jgi:hypothetical protein
MQYIQRRIQIPTDTQTTATPVPAIIECLRDMLATRRTTLRCAGWIHPDQGPTSFCRFVGQDREELAPACVVDRFGQHRASQSFDVQVFNSDQPVLLDERTGRLVVEVAPLVGNVRTDSL